MSFMEYLISFHIINYVYIFTLHIKKWIMYVAKNIMYVVLVILLFSVTEP